MSKGRIDLLDGWRTLAIVCMIVFHIFWDAGLVGWIPRALLFRPLLQTFRLTAVCSFLFLSGISSRFSHSNLRRGLRLAVCAAGISLVMYFMDMPVWFGVLHLLAVCCLLWALLGRWMGRWSARWGCAVCLLLFLLLFFLLRGFYVTVPGLWALGFRTRQFYSADYYPLLPWSLLFFAGAFAGGEILDHPAPWQARRLPAALTWPGRHALAIYLIHQPVLYGLTVLLAGGMR